MLCKLPSLEYFSSSEPPVCPSELTTFVCVNWIPQFSAIQFSLADVNLPVERQGLTNRVFTSTYVLKNCLKTNNYINLEQVVPFPKSKKLLNLQVKGTLQLKVRKSSCNFSLTTALVINFKFYLKILR